MLIDASVRCGEIDRAVSFVEKIVSGKIEACQANMLDEVSFNTLLKGCAMQKQFEKSFELLDLMLSLKLKPNQVTFNSMIEICVRCGKIDDAWSLLTKMRYSGITPDNFTLSSLIKGIKPCRDFWN